MAEVHVLEEQRRPFFTPKGFAEYLQVSERTVREWIAEGELPSYRFGGSRRIKAEDGDTFIRDHLEGRTAA